MNQIALRSSTLTTYTVRRPFRVPVASIHICRRIKMIVSLRTATLVLCAMLSSGSIAVAATITLSAGENIQSAVTANPAGTTFILQPGVYRNQNVNLTASQDGDSFIGQAGVDIDGAEVLTGWTQVSINGVLYWTTAAGTPLPTPTCHAGVSVTGVPISCCEPAYPGCTYVQDLYVNSLEYQHVTALDNVMAGTWYYDFDGTDGGVQNNIYLPATINPNSETVELGDTSYAFQGTASNITIKNLTVEKYANQLSTAAIEPYGPGWLIEDNQVLLNHGVGITAGQGGNNVQVLSNSVTYNGQGGMGGPGNGGLWEDNTVAYNNADGVFTGYAGFGADWTGSGITISHNVSHDNYGVGLHVDAGGTYDTINGNISYNNNQSGIRYEVSRYGTITNNTVYGNSPYAQIVYTGSDHGRISGNIVTDNGNGAIVVVNCYGARGGTVYPVTNVQVTGNTIFVSSSANDVVAGLIDHAVPPEPSIFSDPTNFFNNNIYKFSGSSRNSWHWGETSNPLLNMSWSAWQAGGQDLDGTVEVGVPGPQ
jgi:parallel beta-helix repeat protein